MSNLEQVFQARFELLLSASLATPASISAALDVLREVEQHTGIILDEALGAPLATHLATTLKRLLQGDVLQPAPDVLWLELQDYPVQMELARTLTSGLEQHLGVKIPSDESGFIALHLARIAIEVGNSTKTPNPSTREDR